MTEPRFVGGTADFLLSKLFLAEVNQSLHHLFSNP